MSQQIACPTCAKALLVPDDAVGKKVRCPGCQTLIELAPQTNVREAPRSAAPRSAPPPPPPGRRDDDYDDEPRRRSRHDDRDRRDDNRFDDRGEELRPRRRPAKSSSSAGIIIIVCVASVLVIGAVIAVVLLNSGSGGGGVRGGGTALGFNNLLSGGNQRLASAGRTFGESLGRALQSGNQGDMASMRTHYASVQRVLADVRRDVNNFQIAGIDGADQLRAVYLQFLDGQDRMIAQDFAQAMNVVENRGLNMFDKQNQVQNIMNRVQAQENNDLVRLQQAQRDFAGRHRIMLR